jgi:hypothetical protein
VEKRFAATADARGQRAELVALSKSSPCATEIRDNIKRAALPAASPQMAAFLLVETQRALDVL